MTGIDSMITRNTLKGNDSFFLEATKYSLKFSLLLTPILVIIGLFYYFTDNIGLGYTILALSTFKPFYFASRKWTSFMHGKKRFRRASIFQVMVSLDGYFALFFLFYFDNIWYYVIALNIFDMFISFSAFYNSLRFINDSSKLSKINEYGFIETPYREVLDTVKNTEKDF